MGKNIRKVSVVISLASIIALISMRIFLIVEDSMLIPETGGRLISYDFLLLGLVLSTLAFILGLKFRNN